MLNGFLSLASCSLTGAVLAAALPASAQIQQSFIGAAHESTFTRGVAPGYGTAPAAPTLGHLQMVNPGSPANQRPYIAFNSSPDLTGSLANGSAVIEFDYRIPSSGVADGFGVALLKTSVHGGNGALAGSSNVLAAAYNWEQPRPASSFAVGFDIFGSSPDAKNQINLNWNGTRVATVQTDASSFSRYDLKTGHWARVRIEIRKSGADSRVTVKVTSSSSTSNPTTYVPFNNHLVAGMDITGTRLVFGARSGGSPMLLDLDNVRTRRINESVPVASRVYPLDDGALPPPASSAPREIHVHPVTGADSAAGTPAAPLKTIKAAVLEADPGDKIVLASGAHVLSNGDATPATLFLDKRLYFIGQGDTGAARTTVTGDWTDVVDDQFDVGNPLFVLNPHADGSVFQGIEFRGGPGRPADVTAWADSHRPIGSGVRLNAVHDVSLIDSTFINFHGPALYMWEIRRFLSAATDYIDSGYGNTVVATGAAGSEAGAIKFVSMYDSTFDGGNFLNTTGALGTGYGIKITGAIVRNTFRNLTCNLKGGSSWRAADGAGAAPTFFMEATALRHNVSQGFKSTEVRDNVITGCSIRNPLSLQMGNSMDPIPDATRSFHIHGNVFDTKGEYVIEGGTNNLVLEYNHSRTLSFYNNSGAIGRNITIRFNIAEKVDDYFVRLHGDSSNMKVHHNTVTTQNRTINGSVRKPVFLRAQGSEVSGSGLTRAREFRNNVVIGPGGGGTLHFVRFLSLPTGAYTNTIISNNHVHLGEVAAVYNGTNGAITPLPAGILSLAGNTGGTAAANDPQFTGGSGSVWDIYKPQSTSLLRNAGANLGLAGTDATPDIGAVQFQVGDSGPATFAEGAWAFNENAGTSAANGITGAPAAVLNTTSWTAGKAGAALAFNGTAHAELNGYRDHDSNEGSFAAWIKTSQTTQGIIFYGTPVTGGNGFGDQSEVHLHIDDGGYLGFFVTGITNDSNPASGNMRITSPSPVNDNQWRHVAATWKRGGLATLYLDGEPVASAPHNGRSFAFTQTARLGLTATPNRGYSGSLDDARVFRRALAPPEILALRTLLHPLTPLESWRYDHFSTYRATGEAADLADGDGDGLVNLLEFATANPPGEPNATPPAETAMDDGKLSFTFTRLDPATVTYAVQASGDLDGWDTIALLPAGAVAWTLDPGVTVSESDGEGTLLVTINDTIAGAPGRFLRLQVTAP